MITNTIFNLISPLDQFGSDNFFFSIINMVRCSFLYKADVLSLFELVDSSFLQSIGSAIAGVVFFDDDDCGDSE